MVKKNLFSRVYSVFFIALLLYGCGGSNSDSSADGGCESLAGRLITDEIVTASACVWTSHSEVQVYDIVQDVCDISITSNQGIFSGSIDQSNASWSAEFAYEEGIMSITALDLAISGDTVTGTSSWAWSDGNNNCSGATDISGTLTRPLTVTVPDSPANLSVRPITSALLNLSWTDQSNNETGFIIERSRVSATDGFEEVITLADNVESYDDYGLDAFTRYWYRIVASNSAGHSGFSNVADSITLTSPALVPLGPSNLMATATSRTSINLSWVDHSEHETGFVIERRGTSESDSFVEIATVAANVVSFDDVGLTEVTQFWYRIRAINNAGNSTYSNAVTATTLSTSDVIPFAPADLVATVISDSEINLSWSDLADNEDGFIIERSEISDTTGFVQAANVAADVVVFNDAGLSASTEYWYRISAINNAGNSVSSNVDSAITETFVTNCDVVSNCQFLIGAGVYDVTGPAAELGMMGYSVIGQKTLGIHTRLYSRAFVFADEANDKRVVYVSADLLFVPHAVKLGVLEKLHVVYGDLYTKDNVMLSATHTHSGPGGYSGYTLYDFSILGFDRQNFNAIVEGIYQSIVRAHNNVAPARIKINKGDLFNAGFNRSADPYAANADAYAGDYVYNMDTEMQLLRLERPDGQEVGMINWFAVHPTSIGNTNRLISSDNKGYASFYFEKSKSTSYQASETFVGVFAQSNSGDISPNLPSTGGYPDGVTDYARMADIGDKLLNKATELYDSADNVLYGSVDYRHTFLDFSVGGAMHSSGRACVGAMGLSFAGGSHEDGLGLGIVPEGFIYGINWPAFTLLPEDQACQEEKVILLPTARLIPYPWTTGVVPVQIIKIGNLALVGLPVEASTMAGRRIREAVQDELSVSGVEHVVFAGYANDYSGYVTTAEEYALQHYEGASTLFGPNTEQVFREETVKLAQSINDGTTVEPGPEPRDARNGAISFVLGVIFDGGIFDNSHFGDVHTDVNATYNVGDTVSVKFWGGHPKNDLRTQDTFLKVQKKVGASWQTVALDNDPVTRYKWKRNFISNSLVTIEWDIPSDAEQGEYKIIHYGNWKYIFTGAIS